MQTPFRACVKISHLPVSRNSSLTVLSGTDNGHAAQDRLGRGGVHNVVGVSFGGALQPAQTLTDDNLNKYPVNKDEQVDYSYLTSNSASKLQSPRYAIPSRDLTSKRFSIVSAYAEYEPPPINISLSKSQHESNEPVNREHACTSKFKKYPPPTFSGIRREWPEFRTVWKRYVASEFQKDEEKAAALRSSLSVAAFDCIKSIYPHQPNAYERQWDKVERKYSDVSMCVCRVYMMS